IEAAYHLIRPGGGQFTIPPFHPYSNQSTSAVVEDRTDRLIPDTPSLVVRRQPPARLCKPSTTGRVPSLAEQHREEIKIVDHLQCELSRLENRYRFMPAVIARRHGHSSERCQAAELASESRQTARSL